MGASSVACLLLPSNTMAPTVMASSATTVAPFQGLKSTAGLPVSRRSAASLGSVSNGGRIRCMQVWPIEGIKKFETLSYLPPLSAEALLKQIDFLIRSKWVPCLEFSKVGFIFREHGSTPGYYDGRYWTMWKLPMFGCTDAAQVLKEVEEVKKEYPDAYVRIIGFDNIRQVQCVSFIAFKPPGCEESGKA
ncbi:ribulose bisphosphate carboxylase small subunit, chloroplastic 1-like [Lolium rigidum]|uniref:ribulose bisphosphate carboxylase small subunit, chloroplastic 1-like n=1 Tax=Lolium rigidum TaxID=89674 RepID=UPI001F5D9785|nr:ribulose bisphosphate carboxylase small subunit, chloroplastic 1-like [Lolium rigidum]